MAYQSFFATNVASKPGTAAPKAGGGYTSFFGNTVQRTQAQGGDKPTKPQLTPDQQVQQATVAGKKEGEEAKKRAEQQQPKQSLFSKVKTAGKDLVVGAGHIAAKAENTTLAGLGAVAGTAISAGQDRLGYKDAAQSTRNKTVKAVNSLLDRGIDKQGGYLTSKQSDANASLKDEKQLVKNVTHGATDITPFVVPGAKGGSLFSKITRDAIANGIVGASGTAAQEKLDGQKLNPKEIVKGAAVNAAFSVGAHGVTAGTKGVVGKLKGKDVPVQPELPTPTHTTPQPGDIIQPSKPELDPNTGKVLHDTMATVHQPRAVADAEAAQQAASEEAAKQSEQTAKDVAKATADTKKIDQQLEIYTAKAKDAEDGKLSNVDQVKVKQLKEQKAELSKQIEDNTNLADIAQHDANGRVEGNEQTKLEQSQANPVERAKAEAELAKTDPALAGKSTVSSSAGRLFMDAQKAGKPITMEEARVRASSAAPVATPKESLSDAARPELGKPATKPSEVSSTKSTPEHEKFHSRVYERLQQEQPEVLKGDVKYQGVNLKQDAEKAVKLVESDKNKAYRVAMGHEASSDVTATSVNIALAEKALQDGNHSLYAQLVKNRSLRLTRAGQEIVAEKGSVTDNSTSRYVKELVNARLGKLGNGYLADIKTKLGKAGTKERAIAQIDREVVKAQRKISGKQLDLSAAQKLIDSLAC